MTNVETFNLPDLMDDPNPATNVAFELFKMPPLIRDRVKVDFGDWLIERYQNYLDRIGNKGIVEGETIFTNDKNGYISTDSGYGNLRVRRNFPGGIISVYFHVGPTKFLKDLGMTEFKEITTNGSNSTDRNARLWFQNGVISSGDQTMVETTTSRFQL